MADGMVALIGETDVAAYEIDSKSGKSGKLTDEVDVAVGRMETVASEMDIEVV